jgi:hypothetical protein
MSTRDIAARPRVACDDARFDQIGATPPSHDDRDFARRLHRRADRPRRHGDDDLDLGSDEIICHWRIPLTLALGVAGLEADVPAFDPAQFTQGVAQGRPHVLRAAEPAEATHALARLRLGGAWRHQRTGRQCGATCEE